MVSMDISLKVRPENLTVCQLPSLEEQNFKGDFFFLSKTQDEISLVCPRGDVPINAIAREDGWRAFQILGVLDFSLIGILAGISRVLAEKNIGIFAVSTFNTDYILVKDKDMDEAKEALTLAGYHVL